MSVQDATLVKAAGKRQSRFTAESLFVPGLLVILLVVLSLVSPVFFSGRNFGQILVQAGTLGIVAVGATYVIIDGDLDLSLGANVALSGVMTAIAIARWDLPWPVGALIGLAVGLLIGLINGLLSSYLNVAAFIATLGTGVLASGIAIHLTNGLTIAGLPDDFAALATGRFLGLQGLVWFMLATFVVGGVVLHFTNFGIRVFSVGGNRDAAYLAGIRVTFIRLMSFVVAGLCGGLAGVLLTARVQAGQPGISTTLTLYATAAVILGGTSILGGQGSLLRTFFGVLLIAVVQNGLDILGVAYSLQQVAVGAVFILAACSEAIRRRR
jgi:ribose transport system permease protein